MYFLKVKLRRKYKLIFGNKVHINLDTKFEGNNFLSSNSSLTSSYIGFASYLGENTKISKTRIGRYTSIGPNVNCIFGNHPTNTFVSTHPAFFSLIGQAGFTFVNKQLFNEFSKPLNTDEPYTIIIGNDVWIGANVSIMDGVKIGDGVIIAANALVIKDVPPYTIIGGIPAKMIKMRFPPDEIEFLLKLKWWDKPKTWIEDHAEYFDDIKKLQNQLLNG